MHITAWDPRALCSQDVLINILQFKMYNLPNATPPFFFLSFFLFLLYPLPLFLSRLWWRWLWWLRRLIVRT